MNKLRSILRQFSFLLVVNLIVLSAACGSNGQSPTAVNSPAITSQATAASAANFQATPAPTLGLASPAPTNATVATAVPPTAGPIISAQTTPGVDALAQSQPELVALYEQASRGAVNIQAFVNTTEGSGLNEGSGFVLDQDRHIVTNDHVVTGADAVIVVFFDGTEAIAKVLGADPGSDLAILQVDQMPDGVHPLALGDSSQTRVGDWVVAIGNPFGLGSSMSVGVVSAIGRIINSLEGPFAIPEAIQTDAAINPGNSGGPLINLQGQVIGVNAQIATNGANANAGVGFAIPANLVHQVAPDLIANGKHEWAWLGIDGAENVNLLIAQANHLNTQSGIYIHSVVPGGPMEAAGVRGSTQAVDLNGLSVPVGGDVILQADGQTVNDFTELVGILANHRPGDQIHLLILRDGQQQDVTVTLGARPSDISNSG